MKDKRKRVDFNQVKFDVRYRVFNDSVVININNLLKQIAKREGISYNQIESLMFHGYIHRGKEISPNIFKVRFGTSATNIRTNIIDNKGKSKPILEVDGETIHRQKMTFDSVSPDRWSNESFLMYYDNVHTRYCGMGSVEAHLKSKSKTPAKKIKILLSKFQMLGLDKIDLKNYIEWVFSNKSKKFTLSLGFLVSDTCIQDWLNKREKVRGNEKKKRASSKWQ